MLVVLYLVFFVVGAVFGSFACCQAYRIRYKEEGKRIGGRSECLFCHHRLAWYELIMGITEGALSAMRKEDWGN